RAPSWHIVFLPAFVLLALLLGLGIALWLSGATVRYRDVVFGVPFIAQIWMYATPVIYPATLVPHKYRWLLLLNPMTAVAEGFRWSLFGTPFFNLWVLATNGAIVAVLVTSGILVFRRSERTIADLV